MQNPFQTPGSLPSTEQLLISGGDARLDLDPLSGLNKYGCQPFPDPQLLAFGSSTASVVSTEGFAVANRLRQELLKAISTESPTDVYDRQIQRIRLEWLKLCELSDVEVELVLSSSGTDIHAIVAQYTGSGVAAPALIIMVEANETGSGVASALTGNNSVEVVQVRIRLDDGMPRPLVEIDAEVEALVTKAVAANRRVLLILVDQSKTGLIAPSPACVMALHRRYPDNIEVLVDACQFRIALPTLRAYLEQGFMVALTGSKFLTGPSFSSVLILPSIIAEHLQKRTFPPGLLSSSKANWPPNWTGAEHLNHDANFGLLLRNEVALEELRRFRAVPETAIINFLQVFAEAIQQRLTSDPHFEPLPVPRLDRRPLIAANSWDHLPTIFPFLLYDSQPSGRIPLSSEQTINIYLQLQNSFCTPASGVQYSLWFRTFDLTDPNSNISRIRCQLGQPVACGFRNDIALGALRLCLSSRLIIEATVCDNKAIAIIKDALAALDKTLLLVQLDR